MKKFLVSRGIKKQGLSNWPNSTSIEADELKIEDGSLVFYKIGMSTRNIVCAIRDWEKVKEVENE